MKSPKTSQKMIFKSLKSLDKMSSDIANERRRIVNSFIVLLQWIDRNVSKEIPLPYRCRLLSGSVFRCEHSSERIFEFCVHSTNYSMLNIETQDTIIFLVENDFFGKLRKEIDEYVKKKEASLRRLEKIKVPASL